MSLNTIFDNGTHKIESAGVVYVKTKEETEREWRDSELLRTDALVILPDFPVNLLPYRSALRNYPESVDFPDGERPTI